MNLEKLILVYPEIPRDCIKVKWDNSKISGMYKDGYRYCGICGYMIKVNELFCRVCRKMFRFNPRTASNINNLVTESRIVKK